MAVAVTATLVSDYRFRGVSLSERKPALQGGLDLGYGGWFGGGWASTLGRGSNGGVECDLYAGRRGDLLGAHYSVAAYVYLYPGLPNPGYVELQGLLAGNVGRGRVTLETSFAPPQGGPHPNFYMGIRGELPLKASGLTLVAGGGQQIGSGHRELDWEVGTRFSSGPVSLGVSVVGSSLGRRYAGADGSTGLVVSAARTW